MPVPTRWLIKTALLYFIASLLVGLLQALRHVGLVPAGAEVLTPGYFHLFMVGWVTQMIIGVAYWMFPTMSREQPRGSERLVLVTYVMLNAGLLLRIVAEPVHSLSPAPVWAWSLVLSAGLQWIAAMLFVWNTWRRVRGR